MKENENIQMDNLARKVIKKAALESPSFDFTTQIMTQVSALKQSEATIYKPLISKTAWLVILGSFAVWIAYTFLGTQTQTQTQGLFSTLDFTAFTNNKVYWVFSEFAFSNTVLYALALLSIMVLVQVTVLAAYFNKRFEG
jgi:hypothetical protein